MGTIDNFLSTFGASPEVPNPHESLDNLVERPGALEAFVADFGGATESYWFYDHTVEIRFDKKEHQYFLVEELGNLTPLLNVSTVSHIVDRSMALIPWTAKVTIEKLLRTIPTQVQGAEIVVPEMSLAGFTELAMQAKSAHRDALESAGNIGHAAHAWIEQHIKCLISGETNVTAMPEDERAKNCCLAALAWIKAHNVRFLCTERKVYSKEHQVSGTLDGMAWTDSCEDKTCCQGHYKDHLSLIDWKSANYLYTEFLYQSAAYLGFILEELRHLG